MKKIIVLALGCFLLLTNCFAQNDARMVEAKAAYLLAEDEFNAGKYEAAISYLNQAVEKLGSANAKILYLKIMAQKEMLRKDTSYFPGLKQSIDAFEKAPDASSFNEEKYLEVVKLKLMLAKNGTEHITAQADEEMKDIYQKYAINGFYLGARLEELQKSRPDFFAQARKSVNADSTETYSGYPSLTFKKGRLIRMMSIFITNNEDKNFSKGNPQYQQFLALFPPTSVMKTESVVKGVTSTTHTWQEGKLIAVVVFTKSVIGLGFGNKAYQSSGSVVVQLNP